MHYLNMALIDKASLLMVPSTYEAGTLYNVLPSGNRAPDSTDQNSGYDQTRADFTFDRGSNAAATRVNADGLIEKYRENLLLQSNQFDTTWATSSLSVTSGQSGYDGSNNAWKFDKTASNANLRQTINTSGVNSFSAYMKAGSLNWGRLQVIDGGNNPRAFFDLQNGVLGTRLSDINSSIEAVGNGWYRCSIVVNSSATQVRIYPAQADNDVSGTSGNILIQNAQLESGLVSTDYLDSGATTAKAGVLIDLPRINYDANGENGALLLEPQRQQLYQYSELFQPSTWQTSGTFNITNNDAISPEGVQNATTLEWATDGFIYNYYPVDYTGQKLTFSFWVKGTAGETIVSRANSSVNSSQLKTHTLTGDWQRVNHTFDGGTFQYTYPIDARQSMTATEVKIFGAQLEAGSYATSYIPNHGTSGGVTRAADSCSVTGVSDVIGQTEGTIFVDLADSNYQSGGNDLWVIQTAVNDTSTAVLIYYTPNSILAYINNGTNSVSLSTPFTLGQRNKIAVAYKNGDYALYLNGSQSDTDSSAIAPPTGMNQVAFGKWLGNQNPQMESVQQAVLFNERLTNEELATLTTL